jgi:hypothetical protein
MSTDDNRIEITAQQASEWAGRARALAQSDATAAQISELRDQLEARITAVNQWVLLLVEWTRRGLLIEAASVDESYPELCKCAHALAMPDDRLAWDQACNRAGVPLNSRIDDDAYVALSDAIGDASSLDEFAQRFQLAVLGRKPLAQRMKALQDLLNAAPRNEAIRKLAKKYESEALAALESDCRAAAAAGRDSELDDALDAIEGLGWESHFSSQFMDWIRAENARRNREQARLGFEALAPRVEEAFAGRDLVLLGALLEEAEQLEQAHGVDQPDSFRSRTRDAFAWAEAERDRLRLESEHESDCEALRRALDQGFSYPELEPIRGAVLRHGIGIPDDLEARYETAENAWRAARRRKTTAVVAASIIAVAAVVGAMLHLSNESAARQRGVELATEIGRLADAGDYGHATELLKSSLDEDPWMEELAELAAVKQRLSGEEPKYAARRGEVRALLASTGAAGQRDEKQFIEQIASLRVAMEKSGPLERLTSDERSQAAMQLASLEKQLTTLRASSIRAASERFDELRRIAATLKQEPDRPIQERNSEDATKAYLSRLRELDDRIVAFLKDAPTDLPERIEAQRIRDRLAKDITAASAALPRLSEAKTLIERLATKPASESEYAALVERIAAEFGDQAALADPRLREGLPQIARGLEAARAIEHWRTQVLPELKARDPKGAISIPARRDRAAELAPVLQAHVDNFPTSPYAEVARQWLGLAEVAARGSSEVAGAGALEAVQQAGLLNLVRVPLRGTRFAYCRSDAEGTQVLRGLLNNRSDLLVAPGQLRANIQLNTQHMGAREATTWSAQLAAERERLLTGSLVDTQVVWLRALARIRAESPLEELVATGPVLLELLGVYATTLADCEGLDKQICEEATRLRAKYRSIDSCDWPYLAIQPPNDTKRSIALGDVTTGLFRELPDFAQLADKRLVDFQQSVQRSQAIVIEGVMLPARAGESFRRTSPADLTGSYSALCFDEASRRWVLRDITLRDGQVVGAAEGAPPYALIYARKSR